MGRRRGRSGRRGGERGSGADAVPFSSSSSSSSSSAAAAAAVALFSPVASDPSSAVPDDDGRVPFIPPGVRCPQRIEGLELGVAGRLFFVFSSFVRSFSRV